METPKQGNRICEGEAPAGTVYRKMEAMAYKNLKAVSQPASGATGSLQPVPPATRIMKPLLIAASGSCGSVKRKLRFCSAEAAVLLSGSRGSVPVKPVTNP
jgi:hypothetical protein